jgi:hypothetical protein
MLIQNLVLKMPQWSNIRRSGTHSYKHSIYKKKKKKKSVHALLIFMSVGWRYCVIGHGNYYLCNHKQHSYDTRPGIASVYCPIRTLKILRYRKSVIIFISRNSSIFQMQFRKLGYGRFIFFFNRNHVNQSLRIFKTTSDVRPWTR